MENIIGFVKEHDIANVIALFLFFKNNKLAFISMNPSVPRNLMGTLKVTLSFFLEY
jgi:hypothetical protein